ncbi:hypothetical protein [Thalassotalea piscium]|uniref:Porin n=1 Tax=Thalassotalea piscium TaxID=1230533 RepID=A0A7X0NH02_9GAMM|nr:hypothetical protein [Thalassotalea piscium]MBB6543310.1 hypothetical protein [Thalassotalea piscium]
MKLNKQLCLLSGFAFLLNANLSIASDGKATERKLAEQIQHIELQLEQLKSSQKLTTPTEVSTKNWQINSYGSLVYKSENFFRNTQDINPKRRAKTDLERVVFEFVYNFDPTWEVEIELEYEHGGVGAALEYDGFEEFGEFESEIEAGGEIIVEKLQAKYTHNKYLAIKLGHIFVPVGLGTNLHKPSQYFTAQRHWSEASMLPQVWHETGVNVITKWQNFTAQTLITTGLNSEFFRTYNWVSTGHQRRFESVNADDLAFTLRLDYGDIKNGTGIGISYYNGDTSGNRNNTNKIDADGNLSIIGLSGAWRQGNWTAIGQYLYGELEDSQAITLANKTTPGLKPGNFAQLGSVAESAFVEVAFNSQHMFNLSHPLYLFGAYEYANPVKETESGNAMSRFDTQEYSFGLNYLPTSNLIFKAQLAEQNYAQQNLSNTHSFSLSFGYYFSI